MALPLLNILRRNLSSNRSGGIDKEIKTVNVGRFQTTLSEAKEVLN